MLFTHAFHLTSTVDVRACSLIGEATNRVCAGELKQVCERGNLHLTEADYFAIIDGTAPGLMPLISIQNIEGNQNTSMLIDFAASVTTTFAATCM